MRSGSSPEAPQMVNIAAVLVKSEMLIIVPMIDILLKVVFL